MHLNTFVHAQLYSYSYTLTGTTHTHTLTPTHHLLACEFTPAHFSPPCPHAYQSLLHMGTHSQAQQHTVHTPSYSHIWEPLYAHLHTGSTPTPTHRYRSYAHQHTYTVYIFLYMSNTYMYTHRFITFPPPPPDLPQHSYTHTHMTPSPIHLSCGGGAEARLWASIVGGPRGAAGSSAGPTPTVLGVSPILLPQLTHSLPPKCLICRIDSKPALSRERRACRQRAGAALEIQRGRRQK